MFQYDGTIDLTRPEAKPAEKPQPTATQPAVKPQADPSETRATQPAASTQPAQPAKPVQPAAAPTSPVLYGTQIFATSRPLEEGDSRFLGWKPEVVRLGSLYKYIIGVSESPDQARKNNVAIREEYPGSFMVSISDGVTTRFK